jgi:hypothetical protein
VGSYNSYLPFLWFAESLNIPWLILSDSENLTVKRVKKQFNASIATLPQYTLWSL